MDKFIQPIVIGRYYLVAELSKIIPEDNLETYISHLGEKDTWKLFEAISVCYRNNSVFRHVQDVAYSWTEATLNAEEIYLSDVNEYVNNILRLPEINYHSVRFCEYILKSKDSRLMKEFRPGQPKYSKYIAITENERVKIIDGIHRLVGQVLDKNSNVELFLGSKLQPAVTDSNQNEAKI
jgi:hypothetical protein